MTTKAEYNPSEGFFFHGPYNSILSLPLDHPARMEMYLDPSYSSYAQTEADALLLAESRWQAEQHGTAIDIAMETAQENQKHAPAIGNLMVTKVLEYWYFWPLEPEKQIAQVKAANRLVEDYKQRYLPK